MHRNPPGLSMHKVAERGDLRFNSVSRWLAWQETLHFTAIELGLERCRRVADNLGLLRPNHNVISVAGTNGKGSSVELLALILRRAGYRVGCYTSPHLIRYSERITVDGVEVGDEKLCASFDRIDRARGDISLTYFEFGTLAALDIFRQEQLDITILEVGLGGRLDAVNILDADIALITSIDLDHQQWLGSDRNKIAREKAGIFRNRAPAICSDPNPPSALSDCAHALGTPLFVNGMDFFYEIEEDTWNWRCGETRLSGLPRPMKYCDFQIQNAAGVLMALVKMESEYPVTEEDIHYGLHNFRLAGRFQIIPGKFQTILDVAHNQQAAKALVDTLNVIPKMGKTHIILGMLKDKDRRSFFEALSPVAHTWHTVSLQAERGCDASALAKELKEFGTAENVRCHEKVDEAIKMIRSYAVPGDNIVITGSFLTVGAALKYLL